MRRAAALLALWMISTSAPAQEVQRYVGPDRKPAAVDDTHRLPVSPAPTGVPSAGLSVSVSQAQSSGIVHIGPTNFYGVLATLATGQGPGFVMMWDATTVPPDGVVAPPFCIYVDAGPRTIGVGTAGLAMPATQGLVWAFSSGANCQTKTAATASFVRISYKAQ